MNDELLYVYLVDDSPTVINALRTRVKNEFNLRIRTFNTAEECLEMIAKRVPDMLICDYNLDPYQQNKMNGDQLLQTVRKEYPKLPVIMYSSSTNFNVMLDLMKLGAVDFICRDSKFDQHLVEAVGNTLSAIEKNNERRLTNRGIAVLTLLMISGTIAFYFISLDFLWYLLLTLGITAFGFLLYGYFRNFEFMKKRLRYMGKLFSRSNRKEVSIYIVDDSLIYRLMITNALHLERPYLRPYNITIRVFPSADKCLKEMVIAPPDILILDYLLEDEDDHIKGMNGSKMLNRVKEIAPETEVIMISSNPDLSIAAHLIRDGAKDYILKDQLWPNRIRKTTHQIIKSVKDKHSLKNKLAKIRL